MTIWRATIDRRFKGGVSTWGEQLAKIFVKGYTNKQIILNQKDSLGRNIRVRKISKKYLYCDARQEGLEWLRVNDPVSKLFKYYQNKMLERDIKYGVK